MKRIIVYVESGVVTEIYADTQDIDVTILDEDVEPIDDEQKSECEKLFRVYSVGLSQRG